MLCWWRVRDLDLHSWVRIPVPPIASSVIGQVLFHLLNKHL